MYLIKGIFLLFRKKGEVQDTLQECRIQNPSKKQFKPNFSSLKPAGGVAKYAIKTAALMILGLCFCLALCVCLLGLLISGNWAST